MNEINRKGERPLILDRSCDRSLTLVVLGAHPYASPLRSCNYDLFPEVALYEVVGEYDPFLDDAVALARKWRGHVQMDVVPDLMHGFLYFGMLSEQCQKAGDIVVERLKQALKL